MEEDKLEKDFSSGDASLDTPEHLQRFNSHEKEDDKTFWKRRRRQWKENAKNAKSKFATKEDYLSSDLYARRREREDTKQRWRSVPLEHMKLYPPEIVIDLDYDTVMPDKDLRSLASQLMHAYGSLRKSQRPIKLHFTSFKGAAAEALARVSGANWKVFRHEEPFYNVFDKSKLVYLSPDAPEVIERLKADDVYIIGGLVDDNKLLNTSFNKATELGIRSARLPIKEMAGEEYANLSLCVNQVFDILLDVASNGNWQEAFKTHIPERFKIAYRDEKAKKKTATAVGIPTPDAVAQSTLNDTKSIDASSKPTIDE